MECVHSIKFTGILTTHSAQNELKIQFFAQFSWPTGKNSYWAYLVYFPNQPVELFLYIRLGFENKQYVLGILDACLYHVTQGNGVKFSYIKQRLGINGWQLAKMKKSIPDMSLP